MIASVLLIAVISTACINNIAVQELNNKAADFMAKGDYESAMNRLEASIDLDSTMYQTYYNLGIAAINAKKYEKAIKAFEGGISIKPDYADFYYSLGIAQISLADELVEPAEEKDDSQEEVVSNKEDKDRVVEKETAVELKRSAIENLSKYLEMRPDTEDKDTVQEMIKQSEEFINEGSGENKEA